MNRNLKYTFQKLLKIFKIFEKKNKVLNFRITIPRQYPSIPPIIQNECDDETKDAMDMAEYDEEDDFLKIQESFFEERLDSLGPDLGLRLLRSIDSTVWV